MPEVFEEAEIYKTVLENLTTGVCVADRAGKIQFWNEGAEMITGYLTQELIGRSCHIEPFMHRDEANRVLSGTDSPLPGTIHDRKPRSLDLFLIHKQGQCVPVRVQTFLVRDSHGAIIGAAECFDTHALTPEADVYANPHATGDSVDRLTGILDQTSFEAHLARTLEDFNKDLVPFGVLRTGKR